MNEELIQKKIFEFLDNNKVAVILTIHSDKTFAKDSNQKYFLVKPK